MRGRVEEVRDMAHEEQISKKEIASGETLYMYIELHMDLFFVSVLKHLIFPGFLCMRNASE